jgi:hypothetical protein
MDQAERLIAAREAALAVLVRVLRHYRATVMLEFWGKAYPAGPVPYHPAAYHCLDVAATTRVMLVSNRLLRDWLCELLGLAPDQSVALLTVLIALHDLGKFSRPFQVKRRDLWPTALGDPARDEPQGAGLPVDIVRFPHAWG